MSVTTEKILCGTVDELCEYIRKEYKIVKNDLERDSLNENVGIELFNKSIES